MVYFAATRELWLRAFRGLPVIVLAVLFASCARDEVAPAATDMVPFNVRLDQFAKFHNTGQDDALRTLLTTDAEIQTPATPRGGSVDAFLKKRAASPYTLSFSETETIYSLPGRAVTRSRVRAVAPGRFDLKEVATVDWQLDDGYWRIARLKFNNWPTVIGTWRRSGLNREGSIELRVLPGGRYVVYLADDYSMPAFQGRYELTGNRITFRDTGADDRSAFEPGAGTYLFVATATGGTFRKVSDENTWRNDRFEGAWSAR